MSASLPRGRRGRFGRAAWRLCPSGMMLDQALQHLGELAALGRAERRQQRFLRRGRGRIEAPEQGAPPGGDRGDVAAVVRSSRSRRVSPSAHSLSSTPVMSLRSMASRAPSAAWLIGPNSAKVASTA